MFPAFLKGGQEIAIEGTGLEADLNTEVVRLIGKWLNAGVLEGEILTYPEKGTPQGGVVSPMLSNIFLHYVLDEWFVRDVQPRMKGRCFLIRFADDCAPRRRGKEADMVT